jgi:antitoxin PrlF
MPDATMTSKGQVTIPKEIREKLRLKTGDRLTFWIDDRGEVRIVARNRRLRDMIGFMKGSSKRTIKEAAVEGVLRGLKR